ncbi:MAG: hypothetical protein GY791_12345 [Alphaproteobacteria bacterium]|nr:hypothetical protein [Alphaproteobacteria bacterium]
MKYSDGEEIRLGDRVEVWHGNRGVVVCDIDLSNYTKEYPEADWSYLKTGVLIETEKGGLLYLDEADEDLRLLERSRP